MCRYNPEKMDEYKDIKVNSLAEIHEIISQYELAYKLPREIQYEGNPQPQLFFRGQNIAEWSIQPSPIRIKEIKEEFNK